MDWWIWLIAIAVVVPLLAVILGAIQYARFRNRMPKPPYKPARLHPDIAAWSKQEATMTWVGHSTVYIRLFDIGILTDPVLFEQVGIKLFPGIVIGPKRFTGPALEPKDLDGQVDLLLLSHAHLDHFDLPSIRRVSKGNPGLEVVVAQNTGVLLRRMNVRKIWQVDCEQEIETTVGVKIQAIPVRHWGARFPWNKKYHHTGYLIEYRGARIVFAGDTASTHVFQNLPESELPIDVVCMPIGAYAPDAFQGSHCTPEQAWSMFRDTGAKHLMAMHWNTFILSAEPADEPMRRLLEVAGDDATCIVIREQGDVFHVENAAINRGNAVASRYH